MRISKKAVIEAVRNNRTEDVSEVLEEFGLFKEAPPLPYSATAMSLVTTILSVASAMAQRESLSDELAQEIIDRTARTVDLFPFIQLVVEAADVDVNITNDAIPAMVRTGLLENDVIVADMVMSLDDREFEAVLSLLTSDKIERLNIDFSPVLINRVCAGGLLPLSLLLAYMACCRKPDPPVFGLGIII